MSSTKKYAENLVKLYGGDHRGAKMVMSIRAKSAKTNEEFTRNVEIFQEVEVLEQKSDDIILKKVV